MCQDCISKAMQSWMEQGCFDGYIGVISVLDCKDTGQDEVWIISAQPTKRTRSAAGAIARLLHGVFLSSPLQNDPETQRRLIRASTDPDYRKLLELM